jgi:hypothetical protein
MGKIRNAYTVWNLVEKPKGKRQLVRPRRSWEDNIKNGSQGNRVEGVD